MNCRQCGAHLRIRDRFCPYCGAENLDARKHQEEMERYEKEFRRTKSRVLKRSRQFQGYTLILILIAVFAVCNVAVLLAEKNSYRIAEWMENSEVNRKQDTYRELLQVCESEGQYERMAELNLRLNLYQNETLREFQPVTEAAYYFAEAYACLMKLTDEHMEYGYETESDLLKRLGSRLEQFQEAVSPPTYARTEKGYEGTHREAMEDMKEKLELLIKTCAGVPEEEMEGFWSLSEHQRSVLIGRGLNADE